MILPFSRYLVLSPPDSRLSMRSLELCSFWRRSLQVGTQHLHMHQYVTNSRQEYKKQLFVDAEAFPGNLENLFSKHILNRTAHNLWATRCSPSVATQCTHHLGCVLGWGVFNVTPSVHHVLLKWFQKLFQRPSCINQLFWVEHQNKFYERLNSVNGNMAK